MSPSGHKFVELGVARPTQRGPYGLTRPRTHRARRDTLVLQVAGGRPMPGGDRVTASGPVLRSRSGAEFRGPDRNGRCPCGSARGALGCHGRSDGSWRAGSWTPDRQPPTGFANPGCYARSLGACSAELSGEHYLPAVVREANGPRPLLTVLPALDHPIAIAGPGVATDGLCLGHHRQLAPLDREVARALQAIRLSYGQPRRFSTPSVDGFVLVDGPCLEAWMLKTCFGLLAAHAATVAQPRAGWRKDAEPVLLDVLFRGAAWPVGWGLWLPPSGRAGSAATDPATGPFMSDGSIWGASIDLGGFPLQLLLGPPSGRGAIHRPGGLIIAHDRIDAQTTLAIGWPDGIGGPPVISTRSAAAHA